MLIDLSKHLRTYSRVCMFQGGLYQPMNVGQHAGLGGMVRFDWSRLEGILETIMTKLESHRFFALLSVPFCYFDQW